MMSNVINFFDAYVQQNEQELIDEYMEYRMEQALEGFPVANCAFEGFDEWIDERLYELEKRSESYIKRYGGRYERTT